MTKTQAHLAEELRRTRAHYRISYEGYRNARHCLIKGYDHSFWNDTVTWWLTKLRYHKPYFVQAITAYYQQDAANGQS